MSARKPTSKVPPGLPPMGAPKVIPMPVQNRRSPLLNLLPIIAAILLVIAVVQLSDDVGERIRLGNPELLLARADLAESEAELAIAKATELEGQAAVQRARGEMLAAFPDVLSKGGTMALQIGVAAFIILLGLGVLWLLFTLGFNLGSGGIVRVVRVNAETKQAGSLLQEPQFRAYVASGIAAQHIHAGGYSLAGSYSDMVDQPVLDADIESTGPYGVSVSVDEFEQAE